MKNILELKYLTLEYLWNGEYTLTVNNETIDFLSESDVEVEELISELERINKITTLQLSLSGDSDSITLEIWCCQTFAAIDNISGKLISKLLETDISFNTGLISNMLNVYSSLSENQKLKIILK